MEHTQNSAIQTVDLPTGVDSRFTFDNIITGGSNRLACAVAGDLVKNFSSSSNVVFLHGDSGVGKTHLLHAIGNSLMSEFPSKKICYMHSNDFSNSVITAYKKKIFNIYRDFYRSLDVFLIDNVQLLSGKTHTQEALFDISENFASTNGRLIVASNTAAHCLKDVSGHLVSRFDSGISCFMKTPDLLMRLEIIRLVAKKEGVNISENATKFLAAHVDRDVFSIKGAVVTVAAYAKCWKDKKITAEICWEALKERWPTDTLEVEAREIIRKLYPDPI